MTNNEKTGRKTVSIADQRTQREEAFRQYDERCAKAEEDYKAALYQAKIELETRLAEIEEVTDYGQNGQYYLEEEGVDMIEYEKLGDEAIEGLGCYQRAPEVLDEAIRRNPWNAQAYYNRALPYFVFGQYERAIEDLDEAIRLDPHYALAYNIRGNAYHHLGQYERALEDYDEALGIDPQNGRFYSGRALTYTALGRDQEAEQDIEKAAELGLDISFLKKMVEEVRRQR